MERPEKIRGKQVRECSNSIGEVIDYFYYEELWEYVEQLEKSSFGIRNLHIQLCYDFMQISKKAIDDKIGKEFWDIPEVKEIRIVINYIEKKYPELLKY